MNVVGKKNRHIVRLTSHGVAIFITKKVIMLCVPD